MTGDTRRDRFRAVLEGARCIHPGSVYDPISARIAEDLGFEAGMFAGSIASMTVLGDPDLILLSLTEFAEQARRICRAGDLPLMVDADHGYGNALNVRRTVQELEAAGICAMTVEDTLLPAGFGDGEAARLIPINEGVGKMRAALDARRDARLVIAGRTGALAVTGIDDAIARARAYEAVGVDAVFFTGVKTREQLDALADALRGPILLGGTTAAVMDLAYLSSRKVRVCLQGHQPFMAAVQAVHATLKALREGMAPADLPGVAGGALMKQVTREALFDQRARDFLGGEGGS